MLVLAAAASLKATTAGVIVDGGSPPAVPWQRWSNF